MMRGNHWRAGLAFIAICVILGVALFFIASPQPGSDADDFSIEAKNETPVDSYEPDLAAIDDRDQSLEPEGELAAPQSPAPTAEVDTVTYDPPPNENDPDVEIMNGIAFRRGDHYRPGTAEAQAQSDAEQIRGD